LPEIPTAPSRNGVINVIGQPGICHVSARRKAAVADPVINDDVPMRRKIRQPRSRRQLCSPWAHLRETADEIRRNERLH